MRFELFPTKNLKLENDVGDVKDDKEVVVLVSFQLEVGLHASDLCVSDVTAVQEGEKVYVVSIACSRNRNRNTETYT